ncbi:MAG: GerMN domain-containing protein [Spirochaetales bacterium]|nr:GerMN domain-containing protein [Spirochaetales bacterium]
MPHKKRKAGQEKTNSFGLGLKEKDQTRMSSPRKTPQPSQGSVRRADGPTVALTLIALLLVFAIVLLASLRRNGVFQYGSAAQTITPTIERVSSPENQTGEKIKEDIPLPPQETDALKEPPAPPTQEGTPARVFFVKVSDEGKIGMKGILRTLPISQTPLSASIANLVQGPRPNEISNDVLTLIPEGSELLGARIEGGIAYLNFNETFRFNDLGLEGYRAQVEQVVFTATEYPNIHSVQILIDGEKVDYLGGEGFWVGSPLRRDDF